MGEATAIEWTGPNGKTWSPWFGCTKVHAGCKNCYAEADNTRYNRNGNPRAGVAASWGPGAPRKPRAESGWALPAQWARQAAKAGEWWKVFPSLCDPLDAEAPPGVFQRFCQLIRETARLCGYCLNPTRVGHNPAPCGSASTGGLDWLVLTKRPERANLFPEDVRPLMWLGTSVSDPATADRFAHLLLRARGFGRRFLSVEPMLGPVDARAWVESLDWVICGGESGPNRRPAEVAWYSDLAQQCADAGVPFFMKQDVAMRPGQQGRIPNDLWTRKEFPR